MKLMSTSLEQFSKMCWAVNWAYMEAVERRAGGRTKTSAVDARINFVVGDAVDTCDTICMLSAEGRNAYGVAHDVDEVCVFVPRFCGRSSMILVFFCVCARCVCIFFRVLCSCIFFWFFIVSCGFMLLLFFVCLLFLCSCL